MKLRNIILCASAAVTLCAGARTIDPMTAAVLEGYETILKQNPSDYFTLYQRAAQYYRMSDYQTALSDILRAINATPGKEKDMLCQELSLATDIYIQTGQYTEALAMADRALALQPDDYPMLYKRGNVCLYLKDYAEAKKSFDALRRLQPRSQEAYFGLAQVAAASGQTSEMESLLKEAENCNPSSYITYCRLGDIYTLAGEYPKAAAAYLSAFGLADNNDRPLMSLIDLSRKSYKDVAEALDYAARKSQNHVPLYFLRGNMAMLNGRYADALKAFTSLASLPEGNEASVYDNMARAALAMGQTDRAANYADNALKLGPTARTYVVKSDIELARGNFAAAAAAAGKAKTIDPALNEALLASASAAILENRWDEALTDLNRAAMNDAADLRPLMLRAYVYSNGVKNSRAAQADLKRVASSKATRTSDAVYKALAQRIGGKPLDADATLTAAMAADPSAEAMVYAARYYANTGAPDKAREYIDKARAAGYENIYVLDFERLPGLDLSPVRQK